MHRGTTARSLRLQTAGGQYECVTDTIKRRLESPVASPRATRRDVADDRPDFKKSRIPVALRSPKPIRRDMQRSKGLFSVAPTSTSPDSPAVSTEVTTATLDPKDTNDTHSVAEVKPSDIAKTTVGPADGTPDPVNTPKDESGEKTSDTEMEEFVPQTADGTETVEEARNETETGAGPTAFLGSEPQTFVVEVKRLERRMQPTVGVITRRQSGRVDESLDMPRPPSPHVEVIYCEVDDTPQVKGLLGYIESALS